MGRPRNISTNTDTSYFSDVSPIWTNPHIITDCKAYRQIKAHLPSSLSLETPEERDTTKRSIQNAIKQAGLSIDTISKIWIDKIDDRYHTAAEELAKWDPYKNDYNIPWADDHWAKDTNNIFFRLRSVLIDMCEHWRVCDWEVDKNIIHRQDELIKHRKAIKEQVHDFRLSLNKSGRHDFSSTLLREIAATCFEAPVKFKTETSTHEALQNALKQFESLTSKNINKPIRYGCLVLIDSNTRVPKIHTAFGILLAHLVGEVIQKSRAHQNTALLGYPKKPKLIADLPWKAITHFIQTIDPDELIEANNIRTTVTNFVSNNNILIHLNKK